MASAEEDSLAAKADTANGSGDRIVGGKRQGGFARCLGEGRLFSQSRLIGQRAQALADVFIGLAYHPRRR